jgi:hypothetical protein
MVVSSTELGIRLSFVKTSEFRYATVSGYFFRAVKQPAGEADPSSPYFVEVTIEWKEGYTTK